jgi:sugar lactone lactonase YvrE
LTPFDFDGAEWPESAALERVVFVGEFSRASDLGITGSSWTRLLGLAAGDRDDALSRPMDVATSVDGQTVYVADPEARCVHRFDLSKGRYRALTLAKNERPIFPVGLAVTEDGWLFAADSQAGQLYKLAPGAKSFEPYDISEPLVQPTGLSWSSARQMLYVTDTGNQSVLIIDRQGNVKTTIGMRGAGPAEFNFPTYLSATANGDILVTDSLNFRIQRFDGAGAFVSTFGQNGDSAGDFARPKGIATDSYGHIYVIDALMHAIQIFDDGGRLLLSIGGQGQDPGQFWLPNGISITRDNLIFVTDSYNKRVQVFQYREPTL